VSFFDHSILSQLYDVRVKDNHKISRTKTDQELNNGIVNSQLSSNKLFSIDFFSLSLSVIPIESRYDSCIHIAFFVRALISNLFFSLSPFSFFFGSSFNHLFIIIIVRSFVQSISTLGRLNCMLKSCTILLRTRLLWK